MPFKKYIIVGGQPVIFASNLIHADVANQYKEQVDSAGFLILEHHADRVTVTCMGESSSLNISSKPHLDELLIEKFLS